MARSGNPNPTRARQARAQKRLAEIKSSDLSEVRAALSLAMLELVERIGCEDRQRSDEEICRLCNTVSRVASELRGIFESVEMDQRLTELEKNQNKSGMQS